MEDQDDLTENKIEKENVEKVIKGGECLPFDVGDFFSLLEQRESQSHSLC